MPATGEAGTLTGWGALVHPGKGDIWYQPGADASGWSRWPREAAVWSAALDRGGKSCQVDALTGMPAQAGHVFDRDQDPISLRVVELEVLCC